MNNQIKQINKQATVDNKGQKKTEMQNMPKSCKTTKSSNILMQIDHKKMKKYLHRDVTIMHKTNTLNAKYSKYLHFTCIKNIYGK